MKKYASTLLMLRNAKPKVRKAAIAKANKNLINSLCECSRNILKGTVPLKKAHVRRLKRYKNDLRTLNKKRISLKKKKIILQKGGFLGALLNPLVGLLVSLTR